ncbi:MAG: uracil-DNA glycosylase [Actinobacteria bacterium]|nr:uracil-DNA glycosylase [Actinomycetota bacterium]
MLEEFYNQIKDCNKCSLGKTRTNFVFGTGNKNADIVFVGEAPGFYEDRQGIPFVGSAGKLLDKLLNLIGLNRDDIYIANVLKCRPPQNRDPNSDEIELCKPYLLKQIEIIKPRAICTLGNFATRVILEKNVNISRVRGQCFNMDKYFVFPIYHPAAALHQSTNLSALKEDFLKLKDILDSSSKEEEIEEPVQTALF